jgi:hypothetical protein
MADDFIERLPLRPEERQKLRSLGLGSPLDLAALHLAVPEELTRLLGERSSEILRDVHALLTTLERQILNQPLPGPRALGARLDRAPEVRISPETAGRRNQLAAEVKFLAASPQTPEVERRLMEIDEELRTLDNQHD